MIVDDILDKLDGCFHVEILSTNPVAYRKVFDRHKAAAILLEGPNIVVERRLDDELPDFLSKDSPPAVRVGRKPGPAPR